MLRVGGDVAQSRGSVDFNLSQSAAVGGVNPNYPPAQPYQMGGQMMPPQQQMLGQGGSHPNQQSIESFLTATTSQQPQAAQVPRASDPDQRPLNGTGVYHFSSKFEEMELGDSENYSDDFYSDDFEGHEDADEDRDDGAFAFDETVQKQGKDGGLQDVVNQYAQVLGNLPRDASGASIPQNEQFADSFLKQQRQVQQAYGPDSEIYKTLNPKQSIKAPRLRHQETKADIQTKLQNKLGRELFDQIYEQLYLEI